MDAPLTSTPAAAPATTGAAAPTTTSTTPAAKPAKKSYEDIVDEIETRKPPTAETQKKDFDDWVTERDAEDKAAKEKKDEVISPPKKETADATTEKPTEKPVEKAPPPAEIKVGDKSYKAEDVQELVSTRDKYEKLNDTIIQLEHILKTEPGRVLDNLDKAQVDQWYYDKFVKPEYVKTLPAEEQLKLIHQEQAEKTATETKAKAEAEAQAQTKAQEDKAAANRTVWAKLIGEALDAEGLADSDWAAQRVVHYLKEAQSKGFADARPKDVIGLVKADLLTAQKSVLSKMTPAQIVDILGPDAVTKLREHDTQKHAQSPFENKAKNEGRAVRAPSSKKYRYTSVAQMVEALTKKV